MSLSKKLFEEYKSAKKQCKTDVKKPIVVSAEQSTKKQSSKFKAVPCSCNNPDCSGWQYVMKTSNKESK